MGELKFKEQNIQVILYTIEEEFVISRIFIEGNDQHIIGNNVNDNTRHASYKQKVRYSITDALEKTNVQLFKEASEQELNAFFEEVELRSKLMTPNIDVVNKMWGMRAGIFVYNNNKYYAITYHTKNDKIKSCLLRDDDKRMEGKDIISFKRAISNAIIKGEKLNKNRIDWHYEYQWGEEYGPVVIDDDYEFEEGRLERLNVEMENLEKEVEKQMKIVFYAQGGLE